jgi:hypothetical protein
MLPHILIIPRTVNIACCQTYKGIHGIYKSGQRVATREALIPTHQILQLAVKSGKVHGMINLKKEHLTYALMFISLHGCVRAIFPIPPIDVVQNVD